MARINDTTTFPNTTPALTDHVIGTDVSNTSNSADGETVTFLLSDIADLASNFIASVDLSSDSTVEFTGFDSSKYDGYTFMLQNVRVSNGSDLLFRVSTNGGSSYISTSSYVNGTSGLIFTNYDTNPGDYGISGMVYVYGPHLSRQTFVRSDTVGVADPATFAARSVGEYYNSTTPVDAIQFLPSASTLLSGTITMYGMRNS